jgi:hypothetical protein
VLGSSSQRHPHANLPNDHGRLVWQLLALLRGEIRMHNADRSKILGFAMLGAVAFAIITGVFGAPVAPKSSNVETITGCVDEMPGTQYVLRDESELQLIAMLEPVGFPNENFAKYMGAKVAVTGEIRSSEAGPPIVRVDNLSRIKVISDACGSGPDPNAQRVGREMPAPSAFSTPSKAR